LLRRFAADTPLLHAAGYAPLPPPMRASMISSR